MGRNELGETRESLESAIARHEANQITESDQGFTVGTCIACGYDVDYNDKHTYDQDQKLRHDDSECGPNGRWIDGTWYNKNSDNGNIVAPCSACGVATIVYPAAYGAAYCSDCGQPNEYVYTYSDLPAPTVTESGWPLHGPGCSCSRCDYDWLRDNGVEYSRFVDGKEVNP